MRMHGDLKVFEIGLNAAAESKPQDCMLQTTCGTPPHVAPEAIPRKGYVWASGPKLTSCLTGETVSYFDPHMLALLPPLHGQLDIIGIDVPRLKAMCPISKPISLTFPDNPHKSPLLFELTTKSQFNPRGAFEEIKDLLRGMIDQTKYILLKLEGDHYPYKASVIGDKATKDITDMNNAVKNVASRTRTDSPFFGNSLSISSLTSLPSVPASTVALTTTSSTTAQSKQDEYDDGGGEDLFNDNFMDDYRRMDEPDQYELVGLDESFEDDRDTDQVIQDRRAAKLELEARDVRFSNQKLLQLLHDNDTDDDSYRPSKGSRADFRPPKSYDDVDTDDDLQSSPGRSQRSHSREYVPMPDQTKGFQDEDEDGDEGEFEMYRVQGTPRENIGCQR
ncbi:hypothetical protein Peur_028128 [Populus x canadensis]